MTNQIMLLGYNENIVIKRIVHYNKNKNTPQ